jgi:hypothetical protein
MILGVCDVGYQLSQKEATALLCPLLYIQALGEKQLAFMMGLYKLRKLSKAFFGLDLVFDFAKSNYAPTFVNGFHYSYPNITRLMCWFHI